MTKENRTTIADMLREFEQVLEAERRALISLDTAGIEDAAVKKATLCEAFNARRLEFTPRDRQQLVILELSVRHNLVLLAQAREQIRGKIEAFAGARLSHHPSRKPAADGGRLHVRG
jgi:hypothetical protein